jgi:hypothetical protein
VKALFIVSALLESSVGLALLVAPSLPTWLLFGVGLDTLTARVLGRILGAALTSLGIACWLARSDYRSQAAHGLIVAMTFYNFAAVALLGYAGAVSGPVGIGLWPGVLGHLAMGVWCAATLRGRRAGKRAMSVVGN